MGHRGFYEGVAAFLLGFVVVGLVQKHAGLLVGDVAQLGIVGVATAALIAKRAHSRAAMALLFTLGGVWGARHSGIMRSVKAVEGQATVIRQQPFTNGFNPWPYVLVATDHRQFLVRGRHRVGEVGWLRCPAAGQAADGRAEPCRFSRVTVRRFRPHPIKRFADDKVRQFAASIRAIKPTSAARFYDAVLLARPGRLAAKATAGFQNLGIYHLLITSGLHFAILLRFIRLVFDTILRGAYSATLISPYNWFFVRRLGVGLSFLVLVIYGLGIGLPAAVKRCLFMVGISQLTALLWWEITLSQRLLLSLLAATVIFPLGFFATGSLLSWCCTLVLCLWSASSSVPRIPGTGELPLPSRGHKPKGPQHRLWRFLLWQGQLVLLGFLLVGSYTPIAWLSNGIIAVTFSPLLVIAFTITAIHALSGLDVGLAFIGALADSFLALVSAFERYSPFGLIHFASRSSTGQLLCELAATCICATTWHSFWRRGHTSPVTIWDEGEMAARGSAPSDPGRG